MLKVGGFCIGAFRVHAELGRGASAVVYDATHDASGMPVAIKVIHGDGAVGPRVQASFREEVQAVARLDHPGVVLVFEHGIVTMDEASQSGGAVLAGAPWLAMERAARGTLEGLRGPLAWKDQRGILSALLAALAHAHARGVLHRDVKPANVLLGSPDDLRPAVRLADFGLALALEQGAPGTRACGSPAYMAPEQVEGAWRLFGPPTDLYGVGCIAWHLATGAPPFVGPEAASVMAQQRQAQVPAFVPVAATPQGYEGWLARMLAKSPHDRFQRAADAAWALLQLGEACETPYPRGLPLPAPKVVATTLDLDSLDEDTPDAVPLAPEPLAPDPVDLPPIVAPPVPTSWRSQLPPFPVPRLHGAGLSLWGLRAAPLTGRDGLLEAAWQVVAEASRGTPRALVLRGAPGVGKTRLARELTGRALERGAASVLRATHGPSPGASDGLSGMVARRFSTTGLPREGVIARLAAELAPLGLGALELDATAALVVADSAMVLRPTERWTILRRVLGALASERPVIVWIDDAHWGRDSTEFACWLLDGAPFPCVLVVTTHAEIAHTEAQRAVEALMAHPATTTIVVPPLDPAATVALCEQLLALAPDLRARVAELSEGNPLVVEQIVGAWVARGNLVVDAGSGGWDLSAGDAPSTLREAWGVRLAAALQKITPLDGDDSGVRALVDAAAVLGDRVRDAEWKALATALSEGSPEAVTLLVAVREALVGARLAVPEEGGWSFAHGLLREAVLAQVEAPARIHAAAARVLEARGAALRRVASHHAAAGATDLALEVELREAVRLCDAFELVEASVVLDAMAEQVGTTAVDSSTLRMRVEITILRARLAELRGACEDAAARMAEGVNAVADLGDGPLLARVALAHGVALRSCGRFGPAAAELGRALEAARAAGMQRTEGQTLLALGRLELVRGGLDAADGYLAAAREVGEAAGDPVTAAEAIGRRGDIGRQRGNQEEAATYFEASLARYRALGHMAGTATQLHGLAEAHRLAGRLEEAEAGYHQSIDLDTAMGKDASIPRFNLSLCLLARGRYGEVVEVLTELDAQWERAGRRDMAAYARSGLLCAASQLGDTVLADAMLALLPAAFAEGVVDIDLGQLTRDAARAWEARGDAARARACAGFALAQWVALGDEAEAAGMRGVGDKE